jgi:hypothetical protein
MGSDFMLWDEKLQTRLFSLKTFRTRAAAQRYLDTTTEKNRAYRLYMLNRCLDRDRDAA